MNLKFHDVLEKLIQQIKMNSLPKVRSLDQKRPVQQQKKYALALVSKKCSASLTEVRHARNQLACLESPRKDRALRRSMYVFHFYTQ